MADELSATVANPHSGTSSTIDGRTWLFVPGNRPDRFNKALNTAADEVICDLEDAVAPEHKADARLHVQRWLANGGTAWVRINSWGSEFYERDVVMVSRLPGLRGVIVPKAENAHEIRELKHQLSAACGLVALIETAQGIRRCFDIAECDAVDRLAFGSVDFAADIDAAETDDALLSARSTLVLASRIAGIPAPIDGVTTAVDEPTALSEAATRARNLGFGGKLCIHPAQLPIVAAAFRPTLEQIRWAEIVVAAVAQSGSGVVTVDGQMVDEPVVSRARRVLERAAEQRDFTHSARHADDRQP